jgi:hypothetical protein
MTRLSLCISCLILFGCGQHYAVRIPGVIASLAKGEEARTPDPTEQRRYNAALANYQRALGYKEKPKYVLNGLKAEAKKESKLTTDGYPVLLKSIQDAGLHNVALRMKQEKKTAHK